MAKPLVAIVGRPNVGKSTFFNRICKKRIAIVEDTPGVTRDRLFQDAEWLNYKFTLIDTGGIEPSSEDVILSQMKHQAELAIDAADVILFFVDAKDGLVPADYDVADILRRSDKPVILVVNKTETKADEEMMYDFYALGIGEVFAISGAQGLGLGDLLDEVVKHFDPADEEDNDEQVKKVAIVGKPNVGKSSLTNKILGHNRSIVSDIPGTTRDSIDSPFERDGEKYIIIDTAGMRKKSRIEDESVERYSVIRSLAAVRRADIVVVMIDAEEGITEQDVKIAGFVVEEGKPVIIAVNKWDAIEKDTHTIEEYNKKIVTELAFMTYAPRLYISAKTGQRIDKLFMLIDSVYENSVRRITTGLLNDCIREAVLAVEPPSDKGRRLKIYYATQVATGPPTFVLFVNDAALMHFSYQRYLENFLRKSFDFSGTPVRVFIRQRNEEK
ncbi:MAG: ribosome biogenesis GTPase Der [Clostridiales bacterium]|nr:MAG: ribosome biogenesis GTPase Der [Clostridiales bacterium]